MPPLLPWKGPDPIIVSRRPMMAGRMPANGSESTVTRPAVPPMISFCPDFPLRNTDRHCNDLGLIRDVEAFAIGPAPIFDSGASPRNGMEPDAMNNGDCRTKPFRIND